MSEDKTYNGYTNYETWNVALWLDNDQGSQEWLRNLARGEGDIHDKAESLKDAIEEMNPLNGQNSMFVDLLNGALSDVNWREIIKTAIED